MSEIVTVIATAPTTTTTTTTTTSGETHEIRLDLRMRLLLSNHGRPFRFQLCWVVVVVVVVFGIRYILRRHYQRSIHYRPRLFPLFKLRTPSKFCASTLTAAAAAARGFRFAIHCHARPFAVDDDRRHFRRGFIGILSAAANLSPSSRRRSFRPFNHWKIIRDRDAT